MPARIFIARFPFQNQECPDIADWLVSTVLQMKSDPTIGEILHARYDDTPIFMTRNRAVKDALAKHAEYILMIDSDMKPDLPLPGSRPFWPHAWEFARKHHGPCCVAAPYGGPPPHENVYVFKWATFQSDCPDSNFKLEQFTREEAAYRSGFEGVGALPTGLILMDLRGFSFIKPPWFQYEWEDEYQTHKASTEDCFTTRNLSLAGVPQYVFWDAWAGHHKRKCVGRPTLISSDHVADNLKAALTRPRSDQRMVMVGDGESPRRNGREAHHVVPLG
jgi:hypothetical protein